MIVQSNVARNWVSSDVGRTCVTRCWKKLRPYDVEIDDILFNDILSNVKRNSVSFDVGRNGVSSDVRRIVLLIQILILRKWTCLPSPYNPEFYLLYYTISRAITDVRSRARLPLRRIAEEENLHCCRKRGFAESQKIVSVSDTPIWYSDILSMILRENTNVWICWISRLSAPGTDRRNGESRIWSNTMEITIYYVLSIIMDLLNRLNIWTWFSE